MAIHNTVSDFRAGVVAQDGLQFTSLYRMKILNKGTNIQEIYPTSLVLPGRSFSFYEHDIWGPVRRIPYKRTYTQFNATFIVFQNWKERHDFEFWMDDMIPPTLNADEKLDYTGSTPPTLRESEDLTPEDTIAALSEGLKEALTTRPTNADFDEAYGEYIDYAKTTTIEIDFLNTADRNKVNATMKLFEAYPASISQMAMGSDATGYSTYTIGFQFREYTVI